MLSNRIYISSMLCLSVLAANARQRSETELFDAVRTQLSQIPAREIALAQRAGQAPAIGRELSILAQDSATAIVGYPGGAWAVVCADDMLPVILGYSATPFNPLSINPNMRWWLEAAEKACRDRIDRQHPLTVVAPDPSLYEPSIDALVNARWGQEAPYWNLCPIGTKGDYGWGYDDNSSGRCVTGCVATAMAQVLYYHNAPATGMGGTHSVRVKQAGGGYQTYTVNYDEAVYDWSHMLPEYHYGYSDEEAEAVALLMYHCGVATDMNYATDGSGAYMDDCAAGLRRNFGFTEASYLRRYTYSEDSWMELVYTELNQDRPIIYAGDDMSVMGGHCFVLDGYDAQGYVHINWGWDGSSDGYFNIALLNPGYYQFSSGQEMIIGVQGDGVRKQLRSDTLVVESPGTLAALVTDSMLIEANRLTVIGDINADDIASLRHLIRSANARSLDLRQASIIEGELADSALALCSSLSKLVLPRGLNRLGARALADCNHLYELRLYDREVPKVGAGAFNQVKTQSCHLYVPAASKDKYKRAAQWKTFGDDGMNIIEFGTAFTVRNCTREQYQPNPVFTYNLVGDAVEGEPELVCEATEESEPGKYPIYIKRGTVLNQDVDFVDGFLIITESTQGIEKIQQDNNLPNQMYDLQGRLVIHPHEGQFIIQR